MPNYYVDLATFSGTGVLNATGTQYDSRFLALIDGVGRLVEGYSNRRFYPHTDTRYFDGPGGTVLFVPDLLSVSSVKEDTNEDGTFETTWAATDYILYPRNAAPTSSWGSPYTKLVVNPNSDGTQDEFFKGRNNFQVVGTWGYLNLTATSTLKTSGSLGGAGTTTVALNGSAGTSDLKVGHTILVDSEWMTVTATSGTALTATRAVNGSTAGTHADATAILIVQYPAPVTEAVIIQAARLWQRRASGFATQIGIPETGQVTVFQGGLDRDVRDLLAPYRRFALGGFGI